jgi:hypothetical protein
MSQQHDFMWLLEVTGTYHSGWCVRTVGCIKGCSLDNTCVTNHKPMKPGGCRVENRGRWVSECLNVWMLAASTPPCLFLLTPLMTKFLQIISPISPLHNRSSVCSAVIVERPWGPAMAQLVEALRYETEGLWFDSLPAALWPWCRLSR